MTKKTQIRGMDTRFKISLKLIEFLQWISPPGDTVSSLIMQSKTVLIYLDIFFNISSHSEFKGVASNFREHPE